MNVLPEDQWKWFPPPLSLVEGEWWSEGPPLTAVRLASVGLFRTILPFLCWKICPLQPAVDTITGCENPSWANYHYGLLYSGNSLINSPSGLDTSDWLISTEIRLSSAEQNNNEVRLIIYTVHVECVVVILLILRSHTNVYVWSNGRPVVDDWQHQTKKD